MDKLMNMIEACAVSDAKIKMIQTKYCTGEYTPEKAIDLIAEETERIRLLIDNIKEDNQFMMDRSMEAMNYE